MLHMCSHVYGALSFVSEQQKICLVGFMSGKCVVGMLDRSPAHLSWSCRAVQRGRMRERQCATQQYMVAIDAILRSIHAGNESLYTVYSVHVITAAEYVLCYMINHVLNMACVHSTPTLATTNVCMHCTTLPKPGKPIFTEIGHSQSTTMKACLTQGRPENVT
jgi:hypothetical protein